MIEGEKKKTPIAGRLFFSPFPVKYFLGFRCPFFQREIQRRILSHLALNPDHVAVSFDKNEAARAIYFHRSL